MALAVAGLSRYGAGALAHPHVFAEALVVFVFNEKKLTEIRLAWNLDRAVSAELLRHYDRNGDKKLDSSEAGALAKVAAPEAAAFVNLRFGDMMIELEPVHDFTAAFADGRVTYRFTLSLAAPFDPLRKKVALGLYDPSYYVDLTPLAEGAVQFDGDAPPSCRHAIGEDRSTPLMGGTAFPRIVSLDCRNGAGR